jgi:hypothetical protein
MCACLTSFCLFLPTLTLSSADPPVPCSLPLPHLMPSPSHTAGSGSPRHNPPACLPFYLVGQSLTAADVSLAALVAPLLPVSSMGLSEWWGPSPEQLPKEFRRFCEVRQGRAWELSWCGRGRDW